MPRNSGARIASSPVLAAKLAREAPAISLTPARQVVLLDAAMLWCRDLVFPTARLLATSVGRSPSTILNGFETMPRIHAEIIRREWDVLRPHQSNPDPTDWSPWLIGHVRTLGEIDRVLMRLPSLVSTAVSADTARGDRKSVSALSVAVNIVAVFAEPIALPTDRQLHRIICSVLHAFATEAEDVLTSGEGRAA